MKVSSVPTLLLSPQALPGAGAAVALGFLATNDADEINLVINYVADPGAAGFPTLRVRWFFPTPAWNPITNPATGVIISGGTLVTEDWPLATPGAGGSVVYTLPFIVPAGATGFQGTLRESGPNLALPGTVAVVGYTCVS